MLVTNVILWPWPKLSISQWHQKLYDFVSNILKQSSSLSHQYNDAIIINQVCLIWCQSEFFFGWLRHLASISLILLPLEHSGLKVSKLELFSQLKIVSSNELLHLGHIEYDLYITINWIKCRPGKCVSTQFYSANDIMNFYLNAGFNIHGWFFRLFKSHI